MASRRRIGLFVLVNGRSSTTPTQVHHRELPLIARSPRQLASGNARSRPGGSLPAWRVLARALALPPLMCAALLCGIAPRADAATYSIDASAGSGGTISPSETILVAEGTDQTFTITPDAHYHVADVLVDGASVGAVTTYTFTNVTANHTIAASFGIDQYTLTVSLAGNGTGSVARSPNQASYGWGSVVQLTATPGAGSNFTAWSGAASG
ncbi:MAG: hypothetical protein E6K81_09095, partial [Candidatus Eisenbacteria bacterium]